MGRRSRGGRDRGKGLKDRVEPSLLIVARLNHECKCREMVVGWEEEVKVQRLGNEVILNGSPSGKF
jgi:hypothetical protein